LVAGRARRRSLRLEHRGDSRCAGTLVSPHALKLLAVLAAVAAAVLEEVIFRRWIMDYLDRNSTGVALQVVVSGVAFGLAHGFWGFFGRSFAAALQAVIASGVLGAMLGVVYIMSDRSLAPCIVAHFIITALIESGLVLAAFRGQLGVSPVDATH
jgi:membrane protease YdiL (CAAX protease family)